MSLTAVRAFFVAAAVAATVSLAGVGVSAAEEETDGCTGVSDSPGGFSFFAACAQHDACYRGQLAPRWTCDRRFKADMIAVCKTEATRAERNRCAKWAGTYYAGVRLFGAPSYYDINPANRIYTNMG